MSGTGLLPSARVRVAMLRQAQATTPGSHAILFALSQALADAGNASESADVFRKAFFLCPCTELPPWVGPPRDPRAAAIIRDRAASLIQHGAAFSYLVASLAVAEALSGNTRAVETLVDYTRFFRCETLEEPPGFGGGFHAVLEDEIRLNLTFYDRPANRAIRQAWRHNRVLGSNEPACRALRHAIAARVDAYIAALPADSDSPFVLARPAEVVLNGWAVVSDGKSHHQSHIHPRAWMSGVYYVASPPISRDREQRHGWLRVGPPEHFGVTMADGWGERWVEPKPRTLVLMPGYFFHGTSPMRVDENRVCVAFDVVPAGLPEYVDEADEY